MTAILNIEQGQQTRQVPVTGKRVILGRQADCDIVIADTLASRAHASIEQQAAGYVVADLGSRNGTFVNGKKLAAPAVLKNGDIIQVANVRIQFAAPTAAPSESGPVSAPGPGDDPLDELTEDDLLGAYDQPVRGEAGPSGGGGNTFVVPEDPSVALEQLVDSLPDKSLAESDVTFLNARGQAMHNERTASAKGKRDAVDLFRILILASIRSHATDIHLEPHQTTYGLRLRVDGVLVDVAKMSQPMGQKMVALVKIMGDIDIAQRNALQEGRFSVRVPSRKPGVAHRRIDYRLSFAPAVFGQKLVVRILDEENAPHSLGDLHMPRWMQDELSYQMEQDAGMVLVSGPTGSGKTTTLYSLLRSINAGQRNVVTIEDPVEMQLERVTQMPVDEAQGKSFAAILRSVLRQDPDVIMLGEIRDAETARTAMQAAITGHLVLSTIHTRDTMGSIFRLVDLGVEPYMVSQGLSIVVAQRLVRQLCPFCRKRVQATEQQAKVLSSYKLDPRGMHTSAGCPKCLGTGHSGRRGVFELLPTNTKLKDMIQRSITSTADLMTALEGTPFITLSESGYKLVADGSVAFEEVQRIADKEGGRTR